MDVINTQNRLSALSTVIWKIELFIVQFFDWRSGNVNYDEGRCRLCTITTFCVRFDTSLALAFSRSFYLFPHVIVIIIKKQTNKSIFQFLPGFRIVI